MTAVFEILIAILGLATLMVVHETGHLLAARAFGMRVLTFSIGFGPTLFRIEPEDGYFWFVTAGKRLRLGKHDEQKHGPTVYQVAVIPFLAYVQIAGMNPFEPHDPEDKGSYANASLLGRITAIFGGPLANYLFASVFFFCSFYWGGVEIPPKRGEMGTTVYTVADRPAEKAGIQNGDRIVKVKDTEVKNWTEMAKIISANPEVPLPIEVERAGKRIPITVTPAKTKDGKGRIGVELRAKRRDVDAKEAAMLAVEHPVLVVKTLVVLVGKTITGKIKPEFGGPVMIVREGARMVRRNVFDYLRMLGALSAYLGAFNLIPFPALDGGRLMFLGYEFATRRRPNARLEAHFHIVGFVMLIGLMVYVTLFGQHDLNLGSK